MDDHRRVVITGLGIVSSVGLGLEASWANLLAGRTGIGPITRFDADAFRCQIAGEVRDFDITEYISPKEARRLDPFCHYAIAASDEALTQAGLRDGVSEPSRAGVLVSSGVGGLKTVETQTQVLYGRGPGRVSPLLVPMMIADMAAGCLSIRYDFRGPNLSIVTACASASHSIGEAYWIVRRGDADVMLTGGTEACVTPVGVGGFAAMKALSTRNDDPAHASRPFDKDRDGFVPAEGAGILVLESLAHARERGADILAEIVGYGLSGDAYHITAPDPEGDGARRAISMALERAGLTPADVDYINAHGTSTPLNDKMETGAIKAAFGEEAYRVAVSSTKSMTGHMLGAAGGLESVVCAMAVRNGVVPGTMNHDEPSPECDLDYVPNQCREMPVNVALNINLGFGGHNAAVAFRRFE